MQHLNPRLHRARERYILEHGSVYSWSTDLGDEDEDQELHPAVPRSKAYYRPGEEEPETDDDDCSVRLHSAHTRTLSRSSIRHGLIPLEAVTGKPPAIRRRPLTAEDFLTMERRRLSSSSSSVSSRQQQDGRRKPSSNKLALSFAHEFTLVQDVPRPSPEFELLGKAMVMQHHPQNHHRRHENHHNHRASSPPRIVEHRLRGNPLVKRNPVRLPRGICRNVLGGPYFA